MHSKSFDDLIPHMRRAGFVATSLAAVITAMFGWQLGENIVASFCLAGLLALCTFIVGYSLVAAYHAYKRGMPGVSAAACGLFAVAVAVEFLSHTGFNAANRDATIQQASFQTTGYEDTRKNIKNLEANLARLEAKHDWQKSYEPAEAYDEKIKVAEEKAAYEESRGGCKKRCLALKQEAASLKAERAIAQDRVAVKEEIKIAEADLKAARETASLKTVGHAAGASQGAIIAAVASGDEKPSDSAQFWTGVGISALLALFAICAGGLLNFIAYAFDTAVEAVQVVTERVSETVRGDLPAIAARPAEPAEVHHHHVDDRALAILASLKDRLAKPSLAAAA
jgi:hypothetical protein